MNYKHMSLALALVLLTGCGGGSSSSHNDGKGDIDLAKYYPSESMGKRFSTYSDSTDTGSYTEAIEVVGNKITIKEGETVTEKIVFSDTNITTTLFDSEDGNKVLSMYRHVDLGDTTLFEKIKDTTDTSFGNMIKNTTLTCMLKSKENELKKGIVYSHTGDLLKIECIDEGEIVYNVKADLIGVVSDDLNGSHAYYDKSYYYLEKGLGMVASIDDNCIPNEKFSTVVDDRIECTTKQYDYEFYLP